MSRADSELVHSCAPGEFIAAGGNVGGGTADYVWLVWDKTLPAYMRGKAMLGWAGPVPAA